MEEHEQWIERLERASSARRSSTSACALREGVTLTDLAGAAASLIEGAWLNQCLTAPPRRTAFLRRSGRLLWEGATTARS